VLAMTATGEQIVPRSEREVFERLGMPYREPAER
jgi:DNA polymerase/3'-5' exonuclease PolX